MSGKFKLFVGESYYPLGGYEDFKGSFKTLEEAKISIEHQHDEWAHIVLKDKIILKGYRFGTLNNKWIWEEV